VAAELTPSIRAAAETVQAIFLLRELNTELSGLFIEFSYFISFRILLRAIDSAKVTPAIRSAAVL
jgi:hypothetical protein